MIIEGDYVHTPALGQLEIMRNHVLQPANLLDRVIVPSGSFMMPTFSDVHLHAPQCLYQGTGLHLPLMQWLHEYAFKAEERLDADPQLAGKVYKRLVAQAGVRAFVGKLSMDKSTRPTYMETDAKASLEAAQAFCDPCVDAVSGLPSSRHALVLSERGKHDMEVFAQHNLFTPHTIQVHCTFLDPPSLSRLAATCTAVAHYPLSNAYKFSAKPSRLREALGIGVRVGLGTDVAGGYLVDIMSAMRQTIAVSRMHEGTRIVGRSKGQEVLSVDWKEALLLATKGGADELNLPAGCGMFSVGAPFDAHRWWCTGNVQNRRGMWVQGKSIGSFG
ncbi:Metallo-dependent hydrolase [Epithele typhae]|uniref:Metallo-dependent hydrolase n=1 Tax=Epithele typhae TaxID=378194 RepID=UPI0020075527|nr:Metallo-dependent hydrolase [Epithele typhae]KAH9922850.1 Metallo-dependent hydrolase [Epithele typhae]